MLSSLWNYFRKPSLAVKTNFFRLLSIAQQVGLGMRESIRMLKQTENNSVMKKALARMVEDLSAGRSLHDSMAQHSHIFSSSSLALVHAGESMGNLPTILSEIAEDMEEQRKVQQKLQSAFTYPTVLLCFSILAVVILLIYVIPTIVSLFPSMEDLPRITRWMIYLSTIVREAWLLILGGLTAMIVGGWILYQRIAWISIYIDRLLLTIPFIKHITKSLYSYKFCKLLGDFSSAGVNITETFSQMHKLFRHYHYKKKARMIQQDISAGFSIKDAIEGSYFLFDPMLIQTVAIGENTGRMSVVMLTLAEYYRDQLRTHIQRLLSMVEPVLMASVAVIIGTIIASIFLPLADLVTVIGG